MCQYLSFKVGTKDPKVMSYYEAIKRLRDAKGVPWHTCPGLLVGDGHTHLSVNRRYPENVADEVEWLPSGKLEVRSVGGSDTELILRSLERLFGAGKTGFAAIRDHLSRDIIGVEQDLYAISIVGQYLRRGPNKVLRPRSNGRATMFCDEPLAPPRGQTLVHVCGPNQQEAWFIWTVDTRFPVTSYQRFYWWPKAGPAVEYTDANKNPPVIPDVEVVVIELNGDEFDRLMARF